MSPASSWGKTWGGNPPAGLKAREKTTHHFGSGYGGHAHCVHGPEAGGPRLRRMSVPMETVRARRANGRVPPALLLLLWAAHGAGPDPAGAAHGASMTLSNPQTEVRLLRGARAARSASSCTDACCDRVSVLVGVCVRVRVCVQWMRRVQPHGVVAAGGLPAPAPAPARSAPGCQKDALLLAARWRRARGRCPPCLPYRVRAPWACLTCRPHSPRRALLAGAAPRLETARLENAAQARLLFRARRRCAVGPSAPPADPCRARPRGSRLRR